MKPMPIELPFPYQHRQVFNSIPHSEMGWRKRPLHAIKGVCLHRCSVAHDPAEVASWFMKNRGWPGHPYHFHIVMDNGSPVVYQTARLTDWTAGVFGYNFRGVHVMIHGDFRERAPSSPLFYAAACLSADLIGFGVGKDVKGHSERSLSLAKRYWSKKVCPGRAFDLEALRFTVDRILRGQEDGLPVLPVSEPWWAA